MFNIDGGIVAPKGFYASGVHAGIKKKKKDMALVYSKAPCVGAGVFTQNVVKAAPVRWNQEILALEEKIHAIVINSGVANACTGLKGDENNGLFANMVGEALKIKKHGVLVASTGVIGEQLPMTEIQNGVGLLASTLGNSIDHGKLASEAIMTTDTRPKEIAYQFTYESYQITIGGMAKGSGMIHPNMATMLGFITTDLNISQELLNEALKEDVKKTYNRISVDGDTSTNDMVLLLANGEAKNPIVTEKNGLYWMFVKCLHHINLFLAKAIAKDGEGATKLIEVEVRNANSLEKAEKLSKSVVASSLVKTAVYGCDANWGRILCAMGYAEVPFNPDLTDIWIASQGKQIKLVQGGMKTQYLEAEATAILSADEIRIIIDIQEGDDLSYAWGCDLTYDYIKINADYRS